MEEKKTICEAMEENKTAFDYFGQLFAIFGVIVMIFILFALAVGDKACGHSSLFSLGSKGLSVLSLLQEFLLALIITVAQNLFLTGRWIRKMGMGIRYVCFFGSVSVAMAVFAVVFAWFPVNEIRAWICFIISYIVCTAVSIGISRLEEKSENKRMEQALNNFQNDKH